jgi:hypothetical protein
MPRSRVLTELSDHELDTAKDRVWKRIHAINSEMQRRDQIKTYGTDDPVLKTYFGELVITCPVTIQATDETDATRVINDYTTLNSWAPQQLDLDDFHFDNLDLECEDRNL